MMNTLRLLQTHRDALNIKYYDKEKRNFHRQIYRLEKYYKT